jgi:integrase
MIIAALDTGMRRGEMLALRFGDIDWTRRMITLRGATTKSRRTRLVPVGTARLLAVLEWLWLDSAGERKAEDVPVFSNEAGEALKTFKKAWVVAVLRHTASTLAGARAATRTSRPSASNGFGASTYTGTT